MGHTLPLTFTATQWRNDHSDAALASYHRREVLKGHDGALEYKPSDSLILQSFHARERHEPLNGDGFGVGWYVPSIDSTPCVVRSPPHLVAFHRRLASVFDR